MASGFAQETPVDVRSYHRLVCVVNDQFWSSRGPAAAQSVYLSGLAPPRFKLGRWDHRRILLIQFEKVGVAAHDDVGVLSPGEVLRPRLPLPDEFVEIGWRRGDVDSLAAALQGGASLEFMAGKDFLGLGREVSQVDGIREVGIQATRYVAGQFLNRHDDAEDSRRLVAFVLGLTREWNPGWGLQLPQSAILRSLFPGGSGSIRTWTHLPM